MEWESFWNMNAETWERYCRCALATGRIERPTPDELRRPMLYPNTNLVMHEDCLVNENGKLVYSIRKYGRDPEIISRNGFHAILDWESSVGESVHELLEL